MALVRAIGLMSGTSLDGVDIALLETDGERVAAFGPTGYRPYTEQERTLLRRALAEGASLTVRDQRPGVIVLASKAGRGVSSATRRRSRSCPVAPSQPVPTLPT